MIYTRRERVKMSTFGSYAEVQKISQCDHIWKLRPALLFGYLEVDEQCICCETWKGVPWEEIYGAERDSDGDGDRRGSGST